MNVFLKVRKNGVFKYIIKVSLRKAFLFKLLFIDLRERKGKGEREKHRLAVPSY